MSLNIIILAAGRGKRMQSHLPKVLHKLAGKPLLEHIVTKAQQLNPTKLFIVYGHGGEQLRLRFAAWNVQWIEQIEQLGSGHAAAQALPYLDDNAQVLILSGDVPLISVESLQQLIWQTANNSVGLLTALVPDPTGLGRIVRDEVGDVLSIVEDKDASAEQKHIKEINSGILIAPTEQLRHWLQLLQNNNAQGEYYLTDIIAMAVVNNIPVTAVAVRSYQEVQGINDRIQLAQLERYYQQLQAKQIMLRGVTFYDPARFDLRGELEVDKDITFDINVIIEGKVKIGRGSYIGANTLLRNVVIGENVIVKSHSVIEGAVICNNCVIGPFARIRPGTELLDDVQVGNFVEIKQSKIAGKTKINHLSYVGDAIIGKAVNIGAGTITCNYDGLNKHQTIIGDNVFVGSNSALVAPIIIGDNATIGAGSTITREAPSNALTISRAEKRVITGWKKPIKKSEE